MTIEMQSDQDRVIVPMRREFVQGMLPGWANALRFCDTFFKSNEVLSVLGSEVEVMSGQEAGASEQRPLAETIQLAELALRRVLGAPEGLAVQVQLIGRGQGATPPRLNLTRIYRKGSAELCVGYEAGVQPPFPVVVDSTWAMTFELRPLGARGGIYPYEGAFEL